MEGVELSIPELAYLLNLVHARGLPGVDDPRLFPETPAEQNNTHAKGREQLEAQAWITPVPDHNAEYEVNSFLFEMVAALAEPRTVILTVKEGPKGRHQAVLHYLAGQLIIELFSPSRSSYRLGLVSGREGMHQRIAQMLGLTQTGQRGQWILDEAAFEKVRSLSRNRQPTKAAKVMRSAGMDSPAGESLLGALSAPGRGQVVVARPEEGSIVAGRRVEVYVEADGAWMVLRTSPEGKEVQVSACDPSDLGALLDAWIEQVSAPKSPPG
jgi:hypothetical protein